MKLNTEVDKATRRDEWMWRVRSDDTVTGSTCLALGLAKTEADAQQTAESVRAALAPIFNDNYRSRTAA